MPEWLMKHLSPLPLDILVFDMDGVLIDVSESYRKTIAKTVQIYLETCLGFKKGSAPLITEEHIASFKMAGGFNNDWDLTSGLLLFLISISGLPPLTRADILCFNRRDLPISPETVLQIPLGA